MLPCGGRSIRFRPALDVTEADLEFGLNALDRVLAAVGSEPIRGAGEHVHD
jgi:L-lysine 6-transaminase